MAVYKKCSRCGKKVLEYEQCECMVQVKKDSYKAYKKRRNMDKNEKERQDFYNSKDWIKLRDVIIADCFGLDIFIFYKDRTIEQGYTCHHIIPLTDDWNSRLDVNNIIYVSDRVHKIIHREYDKGEKQKKAMQKVLFELLDRWNKEYKGR